jgi:hypothetical protein
MCQFAGFKAAVFARQPCFEEHALHASPHATTKHAVFALQLLAVDSCSIQTHKRVSAQRSPPEEYTLNYSRDLGHQQGRMRSVMSHA